MIHRSGLEIGQDAYRLLTGIAADCRLRLELPADRRALRQTKEPALIELVELHTGHARRLPFRHARYR